jgi:hypothetical protein
MAGDRIGVEQTSGYLTVLCPVIILHMRSVTWRGVTALPVLHPLWHDGLAAQKPKTLSQDLTDHR